MNWHQLIKKLIGTEVNKSNVSAIVEDVSKKNLEKYLLIITWSYRGILGKKF